MALASIAFLDTSYVIALLNSRDEYHDRAVALFDDVKSARRLWTTEAVLVEIGNSLASTRRQVAISFIEQCYANPNIEVAQVDAPLFRDGFGLYKEREEKEWGLTDCISFVLMRREGISDALTTDKHFEQAGFRRLIV